MRLILRYTKSGLYSDYKGHKETQKYELLGTQIAFMYLHNPESISGSFYRFRRRIRHERVARRCHIAQSVACGFGESVVEQTMNNPSNPEGCIAAERAAVTLEKGCDQVARGASKYTPS